MTPQMQAVRLTLKTRELRLETVPVPEPGPQEVRVRVAAAGVCLSDVHLVDGTLSPARRTDGAVTLGHEVAGTVDATGPGVRGWRPGTRVVMLPGQLRRDGAVVTRGVDFDGGWAQFVLARRDTLVRIPDSLPFEQAAVIPDAVSTPWAAITSTARVQHAEAVGVWGVGGLGAHAVQLLRMSQVSLLVAVDPRPSARERALSLGADAALAPDDPALPELVSRATQGRGLNVAFDFAGVPTARDQAMELLGWSGRLVVAGMWDGPVTIASGVRFGYLRQAVLGHYGSEMVHLEQLVRMAGDGALDLTHSVGETFGLADAAEAIARVRDGGQNHARLVLRP
ncbi:alcohol dehydrogenase catalytic domain-containing protein [Streptomyces sp. NPDC006012]|uniref:alcohol dehydrogenase catalytic domain-containing protein n=1 Tax=Streptomyces sp. NPDC006012 TaxID=3364739 RepID=UPI0036BF1996